ncbi:type II secretion system protein GspD [Oleiphilus sp. HI0071]|uniref:type II secretion system secretin GspD n=2 Tax=unclassified Oleiphilus TaxID=2631174 RepID=UPI0007C2FA39|nr:type II secretion system secretin GspD [Oleiphilus sp. HI0079]KZY60120.1 type II secretion system protein GspD [Oleiphilus sp. HI0065]KZY84326.1 type II secretion system protein GspD [Oleiphilus sp. HI0071]KZZ02426.1 type II secretion system protein GspD [Oleiphilus sp. HI0073]KZZ15791.1 type II secretion system protein GspD [Oleiphilus sp. HI0080]KZZ44821.1 type II secretion system protein GspD [Oleiphilus sp. HI0118]KZZ50304.1 type II secretion system protein GspD [Oleiphilus sp. HI0122]
MRALLISLLFSFAAFSTAEEQTWQVNLKDADIRAFVTQVADITGYSFVIDPRVKGKVTVVSNTPMDKDAVYEMFLSVLGVHGFAAIPGTGVIKIVQQNDAKQEADNPKLLKRVPNEQIVTRVIQVNNANALELVPILRPMVAKYGHLAGVAAANALIISDHVSNIKRISKIINELDSPSKYELEVIQLQEAWVGDMVKLLEELAPSELGQSAQSKGANKFSVVADQRSNRLILRGDEPFREKMRSLISKLDQPSSTGGKTKVVRLKHADAEEIAELLSGLMGDIVSEEAAEKGQAAPKVDASVYADEGLNALVIRAEPSLLQELEGVIEELDVRRAQVLIEAAIVEIQDNTDNKLGIQWALYDEGASIPGAFTNFNEIGLSAANLLGALIDKDNDPNGDLDPSLLGSPTTGLTLGVGDTNSNGVSWGALVQALEGDAGANVLSTPKVITMDNQESSIIVGENIPIITGQSSSGGAGTSDPFTTIEREDVGVKLIVTPSISEGDLVRLEIEQEISGVSPSTAGADIITTKRQIKTNVLADDGETIVLGGLIRDDVRMSESKVPLLGDIPWLGALFRSSSEVVTKQNLLVFLRPTILRDKAATRAVTNDKFDQLWQLNLDLKAAQGEDQEELDKLEKPPVETLYNGMKVR